MDLSAHAPSSEEYYKGVYATVSFMPEAEAAIVRIHGAYIPMTDYQATLAKVGELAQKENVHKVIVEAQELVAFHQPSVEWDLLHWKKAMHDQGLTRYRYVLPAEGGYRKHMEKSMHKICDQHPETHLNQLDVAFCRSLDEAVEE